jgi:hypothetical protein
MTPKASENPLIVREAVAARLLGVSVAALRRWRREHRGPAFVRLGRCIGYRMVDLDAFIAANTVAHSPNHSVASVMAREEHNAL